MFALQLEWNAIGTIVGLLGGTIGIWSGLRALRWDRPVVRLELEYVFGRSDDFVAENSYDASSEVEYKLWLLVHIRNLGSRSLKLERLDMVIFGLFRSVGFKEFRSMVSFCPNTNADSHTHTAPKPATFEMS